MGVVAPEEKTVEILTIYVTLNGTNVKLPEDDTEMSKHVGMDII